jgi:peptidyl-prolyl cis-trans isomerase C
MTSLHYLAISCCALLLTQSLACAPERPSDRTLDTADPDSRSSSTEADRRPVATINGEAITVEDFERRLNGMAPYARARYNTIEKRRELLDSMVAFELLATDAKAKGYDKDPAVAFAMKDTMVRLMLAEEMRERVALADISPAEVERAWRERQDEHAQRPAQRRAAVIEVGDEKTMTTIVGRLDAVKDADVKTRVTTFRKLASRYNLDVSVASVGGDVGFLPPPNLAKDRREVARRAFELKRVGDISKPYKHMDQWNIVLLLDEKSNDSKSKEQSTSELRQYLYEQRRHEAREQFITELKQGKTISVDSDVLKSIKAPEVGATFDDLKVGAPGVKDLKPAQPEP